jgi:hypothetical protein
MPSTEELNIQRATYIEKNILPGMKALFAKHPQLRSATLLLSQYWNDQAIDETHCSACVSVLETPDLDSHFARFGDDCSELDPVNTPFDIDSFELYKITQWGSNDEAIPLFGAFCIGGSQGLVEEYNCRPYCVLRRNDAEPSGFDVDVIGVMYRPHLDGLDPSWESL